MEIETRDGIILRNIPEGTPESEIRARLATIRGGSDTQPRVEQPLVPEPTTRQKIQASAPMRMVQGARDAIDAGAQLLPRAGELVTSGGGLWPNPVSNWFGGEARRVDEMTARNEREYQASREATGATGFDAARLVGNVVSPANVAVASRLPSAVTTVGRIATGAAAGAVGGGMQPVTNVTPEAPFWEQKAGQMGVGAVAGGVASPVLGKLTDALAPRVRAFVDKATFRNAEIGNTRAWSEAEFMIRSALREIGASIDDVPKAQMDSMRKQVQDALKRGNQVDAAALARKADFDALNIPPTQGQITRDATQFARERNLRGVPGVGEPLQARFDTQNQTIQRIVGDLRGAPSEPYQAGRVISDTLKEADEGMRRGVTAQYQAARAASGKDATVPLQGLAQDAAKVLDDFADKVPAGVKSRLASFGLFGGTQTKVYTPDEADKLLKLINDHRGADKATNTALDYLATAVKRSMSEGSVDDVFAGARAAARQRFDLHDAVPALEAAATGRTAPDAFVQKYILSGNVEETRRLADMLKQANPAAFAEARAQVGARIARAAFGENLAGDKLAAPERLAAELRKFGTDKLRAFYTDEEIATLQRVARVSAYINSTPSAAPVNTSNNIGAVLSILGRIPGAPAVLSIANAAKNVAANARDVNAAMAAKVPERTSQLPPELRRELAKALSGASLISGQTAAEPLR